MDVERGNIHCNLNQLYVDTSHALDRIDAHKWDKCVSKVMKEAHQYLVYDGVVTQPPATVTQTATPSFSDISPVVSTSVVPPVEATTSCNLPQETSRNDKIALKALVVKKCHRRKLGNFHLKIHFLRFLKYTNR